MAKEMPVRNKTEQEMEDCGRVNIHIFLSLLDKSWVVSHTWVSWFLAAFSFSRSWKLLNCPAVNKSLITLCHQVQVQFLILKKCSWKRITEAILKMSQKWACHCCFGEKSEETSQSWFPDLSSKLDLIHSTSYFAALFMPPSEYPPEEAMAPHSSTLAWKIPWTEEPGRLWSMGSLRVGHNWAT